MARNNPVVLPLLLTVTSLILAIDNWDDIPSSLPLWWSALGKRRLILPFFLIRFNLPFPMIIGARGTISNYAAGSGSYLIKLN
jgi:hypothetical protein